MNKPALITMLVLGSASVAMAKPALSLEAQASWTASYHSGTPVIRDHREPTFRPPVSTFNPNQSNVKLNTDSSEYIGPIYSLRTQYDYGWAALTDPTRIEKSREIIRVSGRHKALMLQNVKGSSHIKMVNVRFKDGRTQTIKLERNLNSWQPSLQLPLQKGAVDYIVVYGTTTVGSSYRVLGA
ncbi:MAG: hypothetical protein WKG01_11200 [Kofleriaceae bacterium]